MKQLFTMLFIGGFSFFLTAQNPILTVISTNESPMENVQWDINGTIYPTAPLSVNVGDVITPISTNNNTLNGVSTLDLVLIHKHITNTIPFTEPWKSIAADVNNNDMVTTLDIALIKSIVLSQTDQFPGGQSWVFEPASIVVDNNFTSFEFLSIHLGDVNGTAMLISSNVDTRAGGSSLNFSTKNKNLEAGKTYTFPIAAQNFEAIIGGQFTLEFDTEALDFQKIETQGFEDLSLENFGMSLVENGMVLCSWNSLEGKNLGANTPFYNITFTAKKDGQLSEFLQINSKQIVAEAYEENGNSLEVLNIELNFEEVVSPVEFAVFPNPFSEKTTLNFYLEKESKVILEIFDVNGRTIFSQQKNRNQGMHQIEITKEDLPQTGIYFYQLISPNNIHTGKIILE